METQIIEKEWLDFVCNYDLHIRLFLFVSNRATHHHQQFSTSRPLTLTGRSCAQPYSILACSALRSYQREPLIALVAGQSTGPLARDGQSTIKREGELWTWQGCKDSQ